MNKILLISISCLVFLIGCAQTEKQIEIESSNIKTQLSIARLSEENGQLDAAFNIYERLIESEKLIFEQDRDEVNFALGRLYFKQDIWKKALFHLEQVTPIYENSSEVIFWKARTYLKLLEPQKAIALVPSDAVSTKWKVIQGVSLDYLQMHSKAQRIYSGILEKEPVNISVKRNLIYSYILSAQYRLARSELNELAEITGKNKQSEMLTSTIDYLLSGDDKDLDGLNKFLTRPEIQKLSQLLSSIEQ